MATVIAWLTGNRLAQSIGAALVAVLAVLGYGAAQKRKGRKEGAGEVRRRAVAAADNRKEKRDEINDDISAAGGAADRLHDEWTRD
jgi:HAMP domain-containing protein